jgi:hypothetical protein
MNIILDLDSLTLDTFDVTPAGHGGLGSLTGGGVHDDTHHNCV